MGIAVLFPHRIIATYLLTQPSPEETVLLCDQGGNGQLYIAFDFERYVHKEV